MSVCVEFHKGNSGTQAQNPVVYMINSTGTNAQKIEYEKPSYLIANGKLKNNIEYL